MKMTVADMLAVLIAASTSVAIAQTSSYRPSRTAAHPPHRAASFLGRTSHLGQIGRPNHAVARRSVPGPRAGERPTAVADLSENYGMPGTRTIGADAAPESLHTAIR